MHSIKITNLQVPISVEDSKISDANLMAVYGGIKVQLLGNNFLDVTFGGLRLTL